MEKKRIGFVGLGLMGSVITKNLLSSGYPVTGFDIDRSKIEALVKAGGKGIDAPDLLASLVDVILLSLPNSQIVDDVVKRSLRLFETGKQGLILVDMTTADPILSEELAAQLREKGIEMLDATISGGPPVLVEKKATIMVGGQEAVFRACEPILSAISNTVLYLGKNGSGALTKLIVNLILGLNRMALAEGLSLGKRAGMDPHRLLEVLKKSAAYSKIMDIRGVRMVNKDFLPPQGKLEIYLKDVRLMLDLGNRLNFPLPLISLHAQALISEVAKGRGEWDSSDIISFYEELGNI